MWIILYIIIVYILLLIFLPKGNNLQELLNVPIFVVQNLLVKKDNIKTTKVKFGKNRNQYFLFFQPKKNPVTKKNIILYFHGGGWMVGNPKLLKAPAQLFANKGYISVFANYRKAPFASFYEMREDLTLCLKSLLELQKELNLEDKKIIVGGMSAGATLAASLVFDKKELSKLNIENACNNTFTGLMLSGAPIDLSKMKWSIPLWLFAGNNGSEKFRLANPINQYSKEEKDLPILFLHGTKDGLVGYRNVISFLEKTKQLEASSVKLHTMKNGTHMQAADWGHTDNDRRDLIMSWLKNLEQ